MPTFRVITLPGPNGNEHYRSKVVGFLAPSTNTITDDDLLRDWIEIDEDMYNRAVACGTTVSTSPSLQRVNTVADMNVLTGLPTSQNVAFDVLVLNDLDNDRPPKPAVGNYRWTGSFVSLLNYLYPPATT